MSKYEGELTVLQIVDVLVENRDGRYVLVGPIEEARAGRAMIFDTLERGWIRITSNDGEDLLHKETVSKMFERGAGVESIAPRA